MNRSEADFVVVGAGSAGCVLADRLSASGRFQVTLLEHHVVSLSPKFVNRGLSGLVDIAHCDRTAFFTAELDVQTDQRTGLLVEYDATTTIFSNPADERTENYITGRFG